MFYEATAQSSLNCQNKPPCRPVRKFRFKSSNMFVGEKFTKLSHCLCRLFNGWPCVCVWLFNEDARRPRQSERMESARYSRACSTLAICLGSHVCVCPKRVNAAGGELAAKSNIDYYPPLLLCCIPVLKRCYSPLACYWPVCV